MNFPSYEQKDERSMLCGIDGCTLSFIMSRPYQPSLLELYCEHNNTTIPSTSDVASSFNMNTSSTSSQQHPIDTTHHTSSPVVSGPSVSSQS